MNKVEVEVVLSLKLQMWDSLIAECFIYTGPELVSDHQSGEKQRRWSAATHYCLINFYQPAHWMHTVQM